MLLAFAFVLIISIGLQFPKIKEHYNRIDKKDKYLFIGINVIKQFVVAYFIAGVLLIPFNYYNIYNSKENILTFENCELTGVSTYSQNRTIFYKFKGRTNVLYGFKPIMEEIKENKKFTNYFFVAEIRKGFLNTYILEHWDIVKK